METNIQKKTILVVDDESAILAFVSRVLDDENYNVLTASTGWMGLARSRQFDGEIQILLSDFQMPGGMSGVELATAVAAERPQLRVLLMSGFPQVILTSNKEWHFLAKPFVASQLRARVRHGPQGRDARHPARVARAEGPFTRPVFTLVETKFSGIARGLPDVLRSLLGFAP
jgi:DNA-binding NtrC family response regulator